MSRFLGIDFSGNHLMWRPGCRRSNVWVSEVRRNEEGLMLVDLRPVQKLPGDQHPFARLVSFLRRGDFEAAAIDAPFAVPRRFILPDYPAFLHRIGSMANPVGLPFLSAREFVKAVSGDYPPLDPPKRLRVTEAHWKEEGLSVRSTLWSRFRGGAEMTAACIKLLQEVQRPIWPWVQDGRGLLVEAFPMAQLKQWGLPCNRYGKKGQEGELLRKQIIEGLRGRIDLGGFDADLVSSADALDSVLCAFAGVAVRTSKIAILPAESANLEGWIAVHS